MPVAGSEERCVPIHILLYMLYFKTSPILIHYSLHYSIVHRVSARMIDYRHIQLTPINDSIYFIIQDCTIAVHKTHLLLYTAA